MCVTRRFCVFYEKRKKLGFREILCRLLVLSLFVGVIKKIQYLKRHMSNMIVDIHYDIPQEDCEIVALLASEYRNVVKKDDEDHKRKDRLCKL